MGKKKNEKPMRLIAKSNKLIEARHNLDIWELRVFTKMLMMITPDTNTLDYVIPIKEIISDFELSDSQTSYTAIREAADKLLGRKVYIYKHIEGDKWERQATTLIKNYAVPVIKLNDGRFTESENKDRYIKIGFDEDVRDMIVNYKDSFTKLNLTVLAKLSPKSFRMYELMKQYEDTGFRTMTVDELRDIFDLTGLYKLYGSIKQRVIDKAQKDLEKYADITFTYEEIKQGRAVHRLNFHIRSKDKKGKNTPLAGLPSPKMEVEDSSFNPRLLNELVASVGEQWGVSQNVVAQLIEKYEEDRIRQAIDVTRQSIKSGKVKDEAAFFVQAVKKGFVNRTIEKEQKKSKDLVEKKQKIQEKKTLQAELDAVVDAYNIKVNEIIRDITADNADATSLAIAAVKNENQAYFKVRKLDNATLTVEDFRKDKILRGLVIQQIVNQNPQYFTEMEAFYKKKIEKIEESLKLLNA
jgi:plasmid replication initiation protein